MEASIKSFAKVIEDQGVDPKTATQAAIVLANDSQFPERTPRGQRIIDRAFRQMQANKQSKNK